MAKHLSQKRRETSYGPLALVIGTIAVALVVLLVVVLPRLDDSAPAPAPAGADTDTKEQTMASESKTDAKPASTDAYQGSSEVARLLASGEVRSIRLVGDSITAGFGTDGYEDGDLTRRGTIIYDDDGELIHYESGHAARCWANELRAYAQAHGVDRVINAGINGWFMKDLAHNSAAWLGEGADVIFVALGTNDAGYYSAAEYGEDAAVALAAAAGACKELVVVSPITDLRAEPEIVEPISDYRDVLQELCAQRGYTFVDATQAVSIDQFGDQLHPTSEGSLAIWDCIRTALDLS
ncbi:MAG: SGNH/GDSL hydrolase family protein [Atopobiaceae bacterium]|nr:SGNH/GDSL hydrolase family protein [Atopobiaceae bacterium]